MIRAVSWDNLASTFLRIDDTKLGMQGDLPEDLDEGRLLGQLCVHLLHGVLSLVQPVRHPVGRSYRTVNQNWAHEEAALHTEPLDPI